MVKQGIVFCALVMFATAFIASSHAQSGLAVLSPAAQAEIEKLSPAQRAALAHSLLGDTGAPPAAASAPPATRSAPSSVAQSSGVATVAVAPAAVAPAAPAYNWTGCYADAGVGVGILSEDTTGEVGAPPVAATGTTSSGGEGLLGRLGAGCDYQFASRFVAGLFGDYDFTNVSGQDDVGDLVAKNTVQNAWAVGGRAGYPLFPSLLAYIDGGFTEARVQLGGVGFDTSPIFSIGANVDPYTMKGWFGGGGFEMAVDALPGVFWRNEYRFARYSGLSHQIMVAGIASGSSIRIQPDMQSVTTSLVYRFAVPGLSN